ncbi:MAG: 3-isopropylmalate dehydratase small subunit [Paracoccus sp. (in: a-proteobacteria)]|uniref:3-isopropylmalate dehydratase small subunit n=1 Tax=Paracoccus sp. TaxID=267 RepID=UPI002E8C9EAD|nr:3-isopropylmalate dehydratase small subunit [Pseudomonadota bacterium]
MSAPLTRLDSRAVHLPDDNIDTDIIFPARFLLETERAGLGRFAFHDRRFDASGAERADFPLNQPGFRDAQVIVAGAGFGCGSSREHAVWALVDAGIRLVIAPSFGDIFAGNAAKNGLLALTLPPPTCAALAEDAAAGAPFALDIPALTLTVAGRHICDLPLSKAQQEALLNGWDEIDVVLNRDLPDIRAFEAEHARRQPWLFANG